MSGGVCPSPPVEHVSSADQINIIITTFYYNKLKKIRKEEIQPVQQAVKGRGLIDYPFPLREGLTVRLMLPKDIRIISQVPFFGPEVHSVSFSDWRFPSLSCEALSVFWHSTNDPCQANRRCNAQADFSKAGD